MSITPEVVAEPSLDELAQIANRENGFAQDGIERLRAAFVDTACHAMNAGDALWAAKRLLGSKGRDGKGTWASWVEEHLQFSQAVAAVYMRLAFYRADVELWIQDGGSGSIEGARKYLMLLPTLPKGELGNLTKKGEVRRLAKTGMSRAAIARTVGSSEITIACWIDPQYKKRVDQRRRAKRADARRAEKLLLEKQRDDEVRRVGGDVANAYALLRRCAKQLDDHLPRSEEMDEREAIRTALALIHRAEDQVVKALKLGRRS